MHKVISSPAPVNNYVLFIGLKAFFEYQWKETLKLNCLNKSYTYFMNKWSLWFSTKGNSINSIFEGAL